MKKAFIASMLALASLSASAVTWRNAAVFDNGQTVYQFDIERLSVGMGTGLPLLENAYPGINKEKMVRVRARMIDLDPATATGTPEDFVLYVRVADCKAGRGMAGWVNSGASVNEYPFNQLATVQANRSWFAYHLCRFANSQK